MAWGSTNLTPHIKTISQTIGQELSDEELEALTPSQRNAYLSKISKAATQRMSANPKSDPSTSHIRYGTQL
jgi:dihydroxyacid dehydratase/phosphogluconate dehydratase